MAQVDAIIEALKANLKAHKLRYLEVAEALGLSEASVKRLFRTQAFDLAQLECICQLMHMEISDLIQTLQQQAPLKELSLEQEQAIACDRKMLLVTVCVLNRWSMDDIVRAYAISETECIRKLASLDRLNVIELLPKNRIKLRVAANFRWRPGGPIEQFFLQTIQQELFRANFKAPGNKLTILNGMLSESANREFQRKLDQLVRDFDRLNDADANLELAERAGVTLVLAMRDWHYEVFRPLIKTPA